jgi:hypothetical protein
MKCLYLLILLTLAGSCRPTPELNPDPNSDQNLVEIGINQIPLTFSVVYLSARTSNLSSVSATANLYFDKSKISIREAGFCLSQTDSLPQITAVNTRRIKSITNLSTGSAIAKAVFSDLVTGQPYYVDPYVILSDGRVLYGRYNQKESDQKLNPSAIRFQLPTRPTLLPIKLAQRSSIPTPLTSGNQTPIPNYQQLFTLNGHIYAFYPTGALQVYNADIDKWEAKADLGTNVFPNSPIVFSLDNKLYVHSSPLYWYGAQRPTPSMWEYDPSVDQWTDLGKSLGENLFNSFYQLSVNGKAYFYLNYPYGILEFDAVKRQTTQVARASLLANIGSLPYAMGSNQRFYNAVPISGIWGTAPTDYRTKIVQYQPSSDQIVEATSLNTQLAKLGYANSRLVLLQGTDVLTGFGSQISFLLSAGSENVYSTLFEDGLVRYSTVEQRITAVYDLSSLAPNYESYSLKPVLINDRLFVFRPVDGVAMFWEVLLK